MSAKWGGYPRRAVNPYQHIKRGKRPEFGGLYFRSEAEAAVAQALTAIRWQWKYEPREFVFHDVERGVRHYRPDFYAKHVGGEHWIEVKGWLDAKSKTKLRRFAKYYPEEARKLILITDDKNVMEFLRKLPNGVGDYVEVWSLRKLTQLAG